MEFPAFITPTVIVALISAVVGLIVKAVRLQSKVDHLADESSELYGKIGRLDGVLTAHRENTDIHFNLRLSQEVDRRNEQRFVTIERQLGEIKDLVKQAIPK